MHLRTLYVGKILDKIDVGGDSTYMLMLGGVDVAARSPGVRPWISMRSRVGVVRDLSGST